MGQEIATATFSEADFAEFRARLEAETDLLDRWFADGTLTGGEPTAGFELECWLVGADLRPSAKGTEVLARVDDPQVVPELATFVIEINGDPGPLAGDSLSQLAARLSATLARCAEAAAGLDSRIGLIGILPTVAPGDLSVESMTPRARYRALNDRLLALRRERPFSLRIRGRESLEMEWHDVMLEAAATSFQVHLKVRPQDAARVYNCSKILSGPMVAIAANSPFLFGRDLWDETRITLFEQSVSPGGPVLEERVSFGFRYAYSTIMETFRANVARYPILLPQLMDGPAERLAHLRLHNGTIWRWNRPLIGFDACGRPHLRIEHRVLPAGPSVPDALANAALYLGAVLDLTADPVPPEPRFPFEEAKTAFYACAREGLDAQIPWMDGRRLPVTEVLAQDIVPRARRGLAAAGADRAEIAHWLGIAAERVARRRTGARWQRAWVERHGRDMRGLVGAYLERQWSGRPVHEWDIG